MTKAHRHGPPVFFHLRLAGRISLILSAAAAAGLFAVVIVVAGRGGDTYRQAVAAYGMARHDLAPALLAFGLGMAAVAGVVTWLVTVFATFRFAGPLYRFSRNLELLIEQGPGAPLLPLRGDDELQQECGLFRDGVARLDEHYRTLRGLVQAAQERTHEDASAALARLRDEESRVSL